MTESALYPNGFIDYLDFAHVDVGEWAWESIGGRLGLIDEKDKKAIPPHRSHFANDSLFSAISGYALRSSISASIRSEAAQVANALKKGKPEEHLYVVVNPMGRGGKWGYAYPFLKAALERRFGKDNVTIALSGWDNAKNIPIYDHIIRAIQAKIDCHEHVRVRTVGGDGLIGETLTDFLTKAGERAVWDCEELGAEFSRGGTAGDLPEATGAPRPHNTGDASAKLVPFYMPKAEITWTNAQGQILSTKTQVIPHTLVGGAGARLFILSERMAKWSLNLKALHPSLPEIRPFALAKKISFATGVGYQGLNILPTYIGSQRASAVVNVRVTVKDNSGVQKFYYQGPSIGALVTATPQVGGIARVPQTDPVVSGKVHIIVMPVERWIPRPLRGISTIAALLEASKPVAWAKDRMGWNKRLYSIVARKRFGMEQGYEYAAGLGDTIEIEYDKPQAMCIDGTGQPHHAQKMTLRLGDMTPLYVRTSEGSVVERLSTGLSTDKIRYSNSALPTFNTPLNPDSMLHHFTPFRFNPLEWLDAKAPKEDIEGRAAAFEQARLHKSPLTGIHGFDYFGASTILAGLYGLIWDKGSLQDYDHFTENASGIGTKVAALIAMGSGSNVLRFYGNVFNYGPMYMIARGVTGLALDLIWKQAGYQDSKLKHFLAESLPIAEVMGVQMLLGTSTALTGLVPLLGKWGGLRTVGEIADELAPIANKVFIAKLALDAGEYASDWFNGTWHRRPTHHVL